MKQTALKLTALTLGVVASVHAASYSALGDNADLFLTGTAALKYDDNIFLAKTGTKSSSIFEIAPGLELASGRASLVKGSISVNETVVRYFDVSSQNTELFNARCGGSYDDAKLSLKLDSGFQQLAQNTRDARLAGVISRRDVTNFAPNAEVSVSEKTIVGAGFSYDDTKYKNGGFADLTTYSIPLLAYYEVTPKLQSGFGYRYRSNDVGGTSADSTENYFNLGARGEFTPKLQGSFTIGYNERKIKSTATTVAHNETGLGIESALNYLYTPKTTFRLSVDNGFDTAATGDSEKSFGLTGGVHAALNEELSVDGSLAYHQYKYLAVGNRKDDLYNGDLGLTYKYNAYLNFGASYTYTSNSSSLSSAEFNDNLFRFSVSVRY